jgi:hypothetical protein
MAGSGCGMISSISLFNPSTPYARGGSPSIMKKERAHVRRNAVAPAAMPPGRVVS